MSTSKSSHLPTPSGSSNSTISPPPADCPDSCDCPGNCDCAENHEQDVDLGRLTTVPDSVPTATLQPITAYKFTGCEHVQVPVRLDNPLPAIDVNFESWCSRIDQRPVHLSVEDIMGTCYECHSRQLCTRCCLCYISTLPKPVTFCDCDAHKFPVRSKNVFDGKPVQEPGPYFHALWRKYFVDGQYVRSTQRRQEQLLLKYRCTKAQLCKRRRAITLELTNVDTPKWDTNLGFVWAAKLDQNRKRKHAEALEDLIRRHTSISRVMKNYEHPDSPPYDSVRLEQLSRAWPFPLLPTECIIDCSEGATERGESKMCGIVPKQTRGHPTFVTKWNGRYVRNLTVARSPRQFEAWPWVPGVSFPSQDAIPSQDTLTRPWSLGELRVEEVYYER